MRPSSDSLIQNVREAIVECSLLILVLFASRKINGQKMFNRRLTKPFLYKWVIFFTLMNIFLKSISESFDKSLLSAGMFNVAGLMFLPLKK